MEIRDPVHGSIHILDEERPIIENPVFQRLRNIKQLGLSEYIFPGATHTRYLHSIGVMSIADKAFSHLFRDSLHEKDIQRLRETLKLAALLHDIGHAPLSHATEMVMPMLKGLCLPDRFIHKLKKDRRATHEDYTIKSIVDSPLTESFKTLQNKWGIDVNCIADLITGFNIDPSYFTIKGINYFPLLNQLVSSEMDCDRMDYLLRDSYFCGVSYGHFDLDWILDNLQICPIKGQAYLGINERAVSTFDDFLLGRFHMFLMVYFHYKSVCLEQILMRYFETCKNEYSIPSKIEEYLVHDDHYLKKTLISSSNKYAKKIISNSIPSKIFECFGPKHMNTIRELESFLKQKKIEYFLCSSKGRLSKYYNQETSAPDLAVKVVRKFHKKELYLDINEATDLFKKYSHAHSVTRLHCDIEELSKENQKILFQIVEKSLKSL